MPDFQFKTADWRGVVKANRRKSYIVIGIFLALFVLLGLLLDFVWHEHGHYVNTYYGQYYVPAPAPDNLLHALLTFQIMPMATLIFAGLSLIWLICTFAFYDRIMLFGTQYHEVTQQDTDPLAQRLYNLVEEMKIAANMPFMPKVYLIEADYMNAFASGYSEKSAMIAVTRALAQSLTRDELCAVVAHELTHIRNQDIKLNLTTLVLGNMLMFMLDMLYYTLLFSGGGGRREKKEGNVFALLFVVVMVLRIVLPFLTFFLMMFLSRSREYMADAGSVELMRDNQPMARALIKISQNHQDPNVMAQYDNHSIEKVRRASYIYDPLKSGVSGEGSDVFSTHPSLKNRLKAIGVEET